VIERLVDALMANASPTAFETRNTGFTCEATLQPVTAEAGCWDLSLRIEEVVLLGMESHGAPGLGIKEPAFSSFRSSGLLRCAEGRWQLFAVQEPPRGLDKQPHSKNWLTLVRLDRAR
jgi:hypothetical protein